MLQQNSLSMMVFLTAFGAVAAANIDPCGASIRHGYNYATQITIKKNLAKATGASYDANACKLQCQSNFEMSFLQAAERGSLTSCQKEDPACLNVVAVVNTDSCACTFEVILSESTISGQLDNYCSISRISDRLYQGLKVEKNPNGVAQRRICWQPESHCDKKYRKGK
ncbi:hypothetical protein BCR37DRAFT_386708 [Protomyces lactucae-debilis]|uniref:Extracellular membrane protein CFEM domain-containing protein n=1 Tax=Protomyces lactucae-debilis TaxID=2754530 RepID=A0A1Y2FI94_PROLT|nr:uncharacterized protein BCR37DRAFT_386708 [Protomyces lactucae-debilis]ORY83672.1 hypothetical protein BCR37DRAFT_386708 [Protomyces lactucae-debilis]